MAGAQRGSGSGSASGSGSSDSWIARLFQCKFFSCFKPQERVQIQLEGFDEVEVLAEISVSGFSRVFRCLDRSTGNIVVVKQIERPKPNPNPNYPSRYLRQVGREIDLLNAVNHDNIVRLLRNVDSEDGRIAYLVFELLDGDLDQYIRNHGGVVEAGIRKRFLHQILSAVAYLHANRILHRDLSPKNLLIDEANNRIKLADFGFARLFGNTYTDKMGTRWYTAPEILFDGIYSTPADMWSVGCIFGEMITGTPIFETDRPSQNELDAIFRVLGTPTRETWPGVTTFIDYPKCRKYMPLDVPRIFADVGPDGVDLVMRMLTMDPDRRITVDAALEHAYFSDLN